MTAMVTEPCAGSKAQDGSTTTDEDAPAPVAAGAAEKTVGFDPRLYRMQVFVVGKPAGTVPKSSSPALFNCWNLATSAGATYLFVGGRCTV